MITAILVLVHLFVERYVDAILDKESADDLTHLHSMLIR